MRTEAGNISQEIPPSHEDSATQGSTLLNQYSNPREEMQCKT